MGREDRRIRREKQRTARKAAKKALREDTSPDNMLMHLRLLADQKPGEVHYAVSKECTIALTRENGKEIVGMVDSEDVLFTLDDIDITSAIQVASDQGTLLKEIGDLVHRDVSSGEAQALAAVVQALDNHVGAA